MRLLWKQQVGARLWTMAGRSSLKGLRAFPVHDHDFAEVFWIESGSAVHLVNGKRIAMSAGDGAFIRPRDQHGFSSDSAGFVICNVPISSAHWRELRDRYFAATQSGWEPGEPLPHIFRLTLDAARRLRMMFETLLLRPDSRLETEWFLINLWHELRLSDDEFPWQAAPRWLADACRRLEDPKWFAEGTQALARLAGRCPEHVARVVRRTCGKTPTEILNDARLRYAAQQLLLSDRKVLDIALECGFGSLAHFYSLFSAKYKTTPRQYRIQRRLRPHI